MRLQGGLDSLCRRWQTVPAVKKLGLDIDGAENTIGLLREARRDVEQVRVGLGDLTGLRH